MGYRRRRKLDSCARMWSSCRHLLLLYLLAVYITRPWCIPRGYKRSVSDAHFVLSLGAKVNNNKRRVSIVYRNPGGTWKFDIKDSHSLTPIIPSWRILTWIQVYKSTLLHFLFLPPCCTLSLEMFICRLLEQEEKARGRTTSGIVSLVNFTHFPN